MQKSAKTAGIAYLLIISTSILSMILGPYKLIVEGDYTTTIQNISSEQVLFRAGLTYDLLMFIAVIILSVALYTALKTVNKTVALTALISRMGEAFTGCLTVVCSVAILLVINNGDTPESIQKTVTLLLQIKDSLMNIVFSFLGFGTVLFCYNFYLSKMIPRWLSVFGMLAFSLVFAESLGVVLFDMNSSAVTGIPAILFEITIGFWLWIRGIIKTT